MVWWLFIVILVALYALWSEDRSQNALGQKCCNSTPEATFDDSPHVIIEKTVVTLKKNHSLVSWRRALLVGLAVTIPLLLFLNHRFPTGYTFAIVASLIAMGSYFAYIWFEYSWLHPNDVAAESLLLRLRDAHKL